MSRLPFDPQANLEELLGLAKKRYEVGFEPVSIGEQSLEILQIADMEAYIDRLAAKTESNLQLPFWAKIWPTSVLLAYFGQKIRPVSDNSRFLEIGAGIGLCGLAAARQGLRVTISDLEPDALLFSQINILKNRVQDRAQTLKADFTRDRLNQKFDYIFGSEVLYRPKTYPPLLDFLQAHLCDHPQATIFLAQGYTRQAKDFFELAQKRFAIQQQLIGYKEDTDQEAEKHMSIIYRLRTKED